MSGSERVNLLGEHSTDYFNSRPVTVEIKMGGFCGPKLSNCCFVLSLWGVLMLIFLGIFFKFEAVALTEDVPEVTPEGYGGTAKNCFIAAGLYGVVFLVSAYQKWAISRGYARI